MNITKNSIFYYKNTLSLGVHSFENLNLEEYLVYCFLKKKKKATLGQIHFLLNIDKLILSQYLNNLMDLDLISYNRGFFVYRGVKNE